MRNPATGDVMNKFEVLGIVGEGEGSPGLKCFPITWRGHHADIPERDCFIKSFWLCLLPVLLR